MAKEDYDLNQTAINAIKEVSIPAIPVSVVLQEAEDLSEWCQPDMELLKKAGLDPELVKDITTRAGALRYIQSIWQKEYKSLEDDQKEWARLSPAGYELRDTLLHHALFAYRKYPDLLAKAQKISEGNGHADMIQDLSDLSVLCISNIEPLKKLEINLNDLDTASEMAESLSSLLAKANGARLADNKNKILRDKAYTYLKQAVDEIRHHGQYVFWKNADRQKGYISIYRKQKSARKATKTNSAKV